jgi:cellulose synthase/poly-beta-1,6-N-acetylglucosamine synthase-like glycosyltransferase
MKTSQAKNRNLALMEKKDPKVSILIPCKRIDARTKCCIKHCMKVNYPDYEILVLPDCDEGKEISDKRVRVIQTGHIKPMAKRFTASSISKGDICAFIDSDAFPDRNWLKNAFRYFEDSSVAAVAGPTLTPHDDDTMAKASGLVLASFGSGSEATRYVSHSRVKHVTETPTCNLIIRRSVLDEVKDFVPEVWPGEEIVLCGSISKELKKKIIYDPQVIVYHHRRRLYLPHLKQIWSYGMVKGSLLKSYSRYIRPQFFLPSLLVVGLLAGFFLAVVNPIIRLFYVSAVIAYVFLSALSGILICFREKSLRLSVLVFGGIIATHITYGLAFVRGLLSPKGLK